MISKTVLEAFFEEVSKIASSRVKSVDAYYQPQVSMVQPPPLESMSTGNQEVISSQANIANQHSIMNRPITIQPTPPSIQGNVPMVAPPFKPKYTGM